MGRKVGKRQARHLARMDELRPIVFARANYRCERCGATESHERALEAHHRLRRGQGGPDTLENLVALCCTPGSGGGCHSYVHAHPTEAIEVGLLIPSWAGPPDEAWEPR